MAGVLLVQLLDLYSLIVLGAVIVSWIQLPPNNPIAGFLAALTEPVLTPMRRIMPDVAGLDFSPMVLLIVIRVIRGLLVNAIIGLS